MADTPNGNGMAASDDELLGRLGAAFSVERVEPPAEGLSALRRAVAERQVAGSGAGAIRSGEWWRRPLPVAGLVFGLVVGGTGAALAAGAPLPRPLRSLAHDIGLPVDSPLLDDVRRANDTLRHDLSTTSPSTGRDAAELTRKLAGLDADERSKVEAESEQLLGEANGGQQGQSGQPAQSGPTGGGDEGGSGRSGGSGGSGGSGSSGDSGSDHGQGGSGSGGGGQSDDGGQPSATITQSPSTTTTTSTPNDNSHRGGNGGGNGGTGGGGDDHAGSGSGKD